MRILFLGNNWVTWKVLTWLREQGEEIVGLVIHPPDRRRYGDEIANGAGVAPSCIFDGSKLRRPEVLEGLKGLKADLAISTLFGYILKPEFIEFFSKGVINLHPSYLPYNRGAFPNVWSIVEGTPAGATLHYIDAGVDTGDIIAQRQMLVEPTDTGESLYRRLEKSCLELFVDTWPLIRTGCAPRTSQVSGEGTYHRTTDVDRIDEIDLDGTYTARELIDIIRARTFSNYPGAYFWEGTHKVYLRMQLLDEEYIAREGDAACN